MSALLFDPRTVPVRSVDAHLPPISPARLQPTALAHHFATLRDWQPVLAKEHRFVDRPPVHASVLVPLVMRAELQVLLTTRTAHLSSHSGQIAFPGGKTDPQDHDAVATALRESSEEIGLCADQVQVLGCMPHYTTGSGFIVTPVVGLLPPDIAVQANPDEVADVFEVPLSFLMNPANHRHHGAQWQGVWCEWLSMPYVQGPQERFIWGATAGMLRNLYHFLHA